MAYLPKTKKQIEEEQQGQEQQTSGAPGGGGQVSPAPGGTGGPAPGGAQGGGQVQTQSAGGQQQQGDTRFGRLRGYLQQNQPGAYDMAQNVGDYLGQQREETVGSAITDYAEQLQQNVSEQTPQYDEELIQQATQDPTALDSEQVQRIQQMRQAEYGGPEDFDTSGIDEAREQYQNRLEMLGTEGGMQSILEELPEYQQLTPGQQAMERALLERDQTARDYLGGLEQQYTQQTDEQLEQARQQAMERIESGQQGAQTTAQRTEANLREALTGRRQEVQQRYEQQLSEAEQQRQQLYDDFIGGNIQKPTISSNPSSAEQQAYDEQMDQFRDTLDRLGLSESQFDKLQSTRQQMQQGVGGPEQLTGYEAQNMILGNRLGYDVDSGQYAIRGGGDWYGVGRDSEDVVNVLDRWLPEDQDKRYNFRPDRTFSESFQNYFDATQPEYAAGRRPQGMKWGWGQTLDHYIPRSGLRNVSDQSVQSLAGDYVAQIDLPTYQPRYSIDPYVSQQIPQGGPVSAATPEEYAQILALQNLAGEQGGTFTPDKQEMAGTFNPGGLDVDINRALGQAQALEDQYQSMLNVRRDQQRQAFNRAMDNLLNQQITWRRT